MLEIQSICYADLLTGISFSCHPGDIYAILGPNGAGKTTLLKAIAGIWQPTSGHVLWQGRPLQSRKRREISQLITFVPQNPQVTFDYSVEEFVAMGRYSHQSEGPLENALQATDLLHLRKRSIHRTSQGERQRAYIARALATEAPIMLFDEPVANLDVRHHRNIWNLLQTLAGRGKILLVANHDLISSQRYCSHAAMINQGRCIAQGKYNDVMTPPLLYQVFGI